MMSGRAVFSGDLRFISLADCFQILGGNNSTGTLNVQTPYVSTPGMIFFVDGNPVDANSGILRGLDAIYPLFGWTEGSFEFFEEVNRRPHVIKNSRMEIVLDALRMLDDGLIQKVGMCSTDYVSESVSGESECGRTNRRPVIRGPLADYMYVIDEEEFHDGVSIVQEGGHGTWIWVILEGVAEMTRNTNKGTMNIARLGEGSFIGTLASFLKRDYARNATIRAVGDIQLGVLDTQRLHREYTALSSDFKALILSLDARLNKITDTAVAVYEHGGGGNGTRWDTNVIVNEGDSTGDVFSINKGTACVVRQTELGRLPLLSLEQGDVFGDLTFLNLGHEPRRAAVVGSEDLELERLDLEMLQQEYHRLSQTLKNLVNNTCTCLSVTTQMALHLLDGAWT